MSDATPDTPVDPTVYDEAVLVGAIALNGGNERHAMERYDSTSEIVVRALAEAGLLRGSLRPQASGTPAETIAEALRDVRLNLGPNALEAIYGGSNHLILSGAERRDIGLIAARALGLEAD